jgi:two-component system sensor histidine kinase CiaH
VFQRTSTKLAVLYLGVMMAISLFFSINVYQLSTNEFDRGFRGQGSIIGNANGGPNFFITPLTRDQLQREQQNRYEEARDRVLSRLVFTNLIILVGGGFLSYYLARRTIRPIEEAHEAQSRFTADASHELRTPIAAMQSEIEVALMNPKLSLKEAKAKLASNLEELAKLTSLSEGLLRLAQLENQDLQYQKVRVETILDQAIARVATLAEKKHILMNSQAEANLVVMGDETSLIEALVIILDNAVKYSHAKTEINLNAHKDQSKVVIRISDHGIGIKATELPHIFDRFYRADTARTKQLISGYGLGLAISKNIIELHNGTISVKSKPAEGTMFTISLPS